MSDNKLTGSIIRLVSAVVLAVLLHVQWRIQFDMVDIHFCFLIGPYGLWRRVGRIEFKSCGRCWSSCLRYRKGIRNYMSLAKYLVPTIRRSLQFFTQAQNLMNFCVYLTAAKRQRIRSYILNENLTTLKVPQTRLYRPQKASWTSQSLAVNSRPQIVSSALSYESPVRAWNSFSFGFWPSTAARTERSQVGTLSLT